MFFRKQILFAVLLIGLGVAAKQHTSANPNFSHFGMQKKYYDVQDGDNLWNVSQKLYGDPTLWRRLAEENGLSEKVFKGPQGPYTKDQEYCPLDKSLVLVYYTFGDTSSVDTAGIAPTPNPKNGAFVPPAPIDFGNGDEIAKWFWIVVLTLVLFFILYKIFSARRKNKESDPVGSGQPQVQGGVDDGHAMQRAMNIANANGINPLKVTNIQKGRFFGRARVFYADKPNGIMKRFNGEEGYRGIILRTNGEEEGVFFLQGCGNDVRQGNFFTGLRFVAEDTQPDVLTQHNLANVIPISEQEGIQKASTDEVSEQPIHSFNAQKKVLEIAEKILTDRQEAFLEVTVGSVKIKLDTLNKVSGNVSRRNQQPKNEASKKTG